MNARSTSLASVVNGDAKPPPEKTIFDLMDNDRFKSGLAAVAGTFITADRMLRLTVNAIKKTPKLMECSSQSLLGAVMTSAALGLEPNTLQQQAFLIPFKGRALRKGKWVDVMEVQFQVGARGFVTLADRAGIRMVADAIHERDVFDHEIGSETFLRYRKFLGERGQLLGAFSFAKFVTGETATVLPLDELWKIRNKSETYRALVSAVENAESDSDRAKAARKLADTPWVMWLDDMAAKSALKKHAKQLPIAANDLQAAVEIDTGSDAHVIDMAAMVDPDMVRAVVREGSAPPALEDNPSETIDYTTGEVFGVRETVAREDDGAPPAADQVDPQHQAVEDGEDRKTYAQIEEAMRTAPNRKVLDQHAKAIEMLDREDFKRELRKFHQDRINALGGA